MMIFSRVLSTHSPASASFFSFLFLIPPFHFALCEDFVISIFYMNLSLQNCCFFVAFMFAFIDAEIFFSLLQRGYFSVPAIAPAEPQRKRKKIEKNENLLSFDDDSSVADGIYICVCVCVCVCMCVPSQLVFSSSF